MSDHDRHPGTHAELAQRLRDSILRLREDIEARSDPVLEEIAGALELLLDLSAHTHEHALSNRGRIEALEAAG